MQLETQEQTSEIGWEKRGLKMKSKLIMGSVLFRYVFLQMSEANSMVLGAPWTYT
jgi:hypothetical protein